MHCSIKYTPPDVIQKFTEKYNSSPEYTAFTPYRICPLGAHVDHQKGKITGFAIDKGIHIAYSPDDSKMIEIQSLQFSTCERWYIDNTPKTKLNNWADHLRGALIALNARYSLQTGMSAIIGGELPIGGLSSSAAVIITFLLALCRVNNIVLSETELIDISKEAENNYVGVACGKLDQSCEVYCRQNKLLYMDMLDNSYELIETNTGMKPYSIAIFFSGLERSLAGSKYNMRVDECKSAAYALKAFSGMEYGKYDNTFLSDVPYSVYLEYKNKLPQSWAKRAEHWYTELERVENGVDAWCNGDIDKFGKLIFESGYSSIYNYEAGSPELIKLYEIMTETKGIYGGRFSGAGFKGCCFALINPDYTDEILSSVKEKYLDFFPQLKEKYSACICGTENGVIL